MSTNTTNFKLIKPELTDSADITAMNSNWDTIDEELKKASHTNVIPITSTDGIAYTATVPGITEIYIGLTLTVLPSRISASRTPTLNINGLGAIRLVMPVNGSNTSGTTQPPVVYGDDTPLEDIDHKTTTASKWLSANKPVTVRYDGTYWETDIVAQSANHLYGSVPIESGGTGANNVVAARENLGVAPAYTYGTEDLIAGTSELATGTLYFVYE